MAMMRFQRILISLLEEKYWILFYTYLILLNFAVNEDLGLSTTNYNEADCESSGLSSSVPSQTQKHALKAQKIVLDIVETPKNIRTECVIHPGLSLFSTLSEIREHSQTAPEIIFNQEEIPKIVRWEKRYYLNPKDTIITCGNVKCERSAYPFKILRNHKGAYIFYGISVNFDDMPLPRYSDDIIWGLLHEESPRTIPFFMYEMGLSLFNYSSTFSRDSDVPFPLHHLQSVNDITSKKYFIDTSKKNSMLKEISPIMYLQSNCGTSTERDVYVRQLMKYQFIDSYGYCLNNKPLPAEFKGDYMQILEDDKFLKFVARYKFVIAIESGVCEDYITEKLWRAIHVGVVPIYFGSPSIRDWLPNEKSAILLQDFPTPKLLSQHIDELMEDDEMYETYLEHKIKGIISNVRLDHELKTRPYQNDRDKLFQEFECFICKKVHQIGNISVNHAMTKKHYNCPEPISALSQSVNPENMHLILKESERCKVAQIFYKVNGI